MVASGCAWFDMDGDGDLDLLLLHGEPGPPGQPVGSLFRQGPPGKFTDVTASSGLIAEGYIHGAAAGDFDNDGDVDLFITGAAGGFLFVNRGNGTFTRSDLGIRHKGWAVPAAWADLNRDGWLDLVVGNYVHDEPKRKCKDQAGRPDFCGPASFAGNTSHIYMNRGGKAFEDVSVRSGIASKAGKALGLVVRDFDGDHRPDILVSNDGMENFLWMQQADGTFREEAMLRGIAYDEAGNSPANMGVACEDFDRDGYFDVLITHLRRESATLWKGLARGQFVDATGRARLKVPSMQSTGWGVAATDLDMDGHLDLLIANGHVAHPSDAGSAATRGKAFWDEYADRNQLLMATGAGAFRLGTAPETGTFGKVPENSRALALADFDQDGDMDFVVTNIAGPARLYENVFPRRGGQWLEVRAIDPALRRDALGARISVLSEGKWTVREILTHTSYLSSHQAVVHFGLPAGKYQQIVVDWPSGPIKRERFAGGDAGRMLVLQRGTGVLVDR